MDWIEVDMVTTMNFRDSFQILLLILSKIQRVNQLLSSLNKTLENLWFSLFCWYEMGILAVIKIMNLWILVIPRVTFKSSYAKVKKTIKTIYLNLSNVGN